MTGFRLYKSTENRFWERVNKDGPIVPYIGTPCWVWTWGCNKEGYGRMSINGKPERAHRYSFELANGPIPKDMVVCHRCDVRACVRPDHLFLGTKGDNIKDTYSKDRRNNPVKFGDIPQKKIISRENIFWAMVNKSGPTMPHMDSVCWEWIGSKQKSGHGIFGRHWRASRYSFELHNGPSKKEMFICHRCDNPACVRPDHLFLGTHKDNMHDMLVKGRRAPTIGENNPKAKLSEVDVIEIRKRWNQATRKHGLRIKIAREYGVTGALIGLITKNKIWTHI